MYISIHALLAESDFSLLCRILFRRYFYPRSPCGERRMYACSTAHTAKFLSTLSLRRATSSKIISSSIIAYFYPRSPCGERLRQAFSCTARHTYFYPRSPCGERPDGSICFDSRLLFLSTLSLRRATCNTHGNTSFIQIFLSTLSLRRATRKSCEGISYFIFLSTLSLRRATIVSSAH